MRRGGACTPLSADAVDWGHDHSRRRHVVPRARAHRGGGDRGTPLAVPLPSGAGRATRTPPGRWSRRRGAGTGTPRHHCSAFVLGAGRRHGRAPATTASPPGRPARRCWRRCAGASVSDVVAVVTRWFGGTLLGVGGLVRAYSDAVALAAGRGGRAAPGATRAGRGRRLPRRRRSPRARAALPRRGRARRVVRRAGDAHARRTGGAVGVAARHPGRADRGRRGSPARSARTGSTCRRKSRRAAGQPAVGGRTEVWLGSSFWGTRPTGQVMPLGPWLQ